MADTLTPEEKKRLTEELTKYANEGATDDDLRKFRDAFISELKKKGGTTQEQGQPSQQPGKPSAPSFGQKVVGEAITQEVQIPLRGQQKAPVQKKPYQDITYKREQLPSETTQMPETPVVKAAKKDFKESQVKPQVQLKSTPEELEAIEKKTEKVDKNGLVLNEYQSTGEIFTDLENINEGEDVNAVFSRIQRRPDLYAKYSGRTPEEVANLQGYETRELYEADRDLVYKNYLADLQSQRLNHEKSLAKANVVIRDILNEKVTPETYGKYTKDKTETTMLGEIVAGPVVDMDKVDEEASAIAEKYNIPPNGAAWRLIKNNLKSDVDTEIDRPQAEVNFKTDFAELNTKRQELFDAGFQADETIYANAEAKLNSLEAQYQQEAKNEFDAIDFEYKTKADQLNKEYAQYTDGIKKQQESLTALYQSGQIDQLAYESAWSKLAEDEKAFYENYKKEFPDNAAYVVKSNEINSRYNRKYELQKQAIASRAEAEMQEAYKKYALEYKEDPELLKKMNDAYRASFEKATQQRAAKMGRAAQLSANPISTFYQSTASALGGVFKGWGGSMNSKTLEVLGESMEQSFMMPKARTKEFSDWIDPQNVVLLSGQLAGSMLPSMTAAAAVAIGTQGAGLPVAAQLIAGGLTGWASETVDIVGRSYLDRFEGTGGNVAEANLAADRSLQSQYDIMFAYSLDALPFVGKALKFIPTIAGRVAAGAGAELLTEMAQEYPQNIADENIQAGREPWANLNEALKDTKRMKETLISIGPVAILGGAGQLGTKSKKSELRDAYIAMQQKSSLNNALPDQKRQYIQNMVFNKNAKFAKGVIGTLFASGKIDEKTSTEMLVEIDRAEKIKQAGKSAGLSGSKLNIYGFYSARAEEAERNAAKFGQDPILSESYKQMAKQYRDAGLDFMKGGKPDLLSVTYADGSQALMVPEDANALFSDANALSLLSKKAVSISAYKEGGQGVKIVDELKGRAETYAKKNRYTEASKMASPLQSLRENIQQRTEQLYIEQAELTESQRQEEIKRIEQEEIAAFEAKEKELEQQKRDQRDVEIEQIQQQREALGVNEVDAFFSDMKPLVGTTVERMEQGKPAPKSAVKVASEYLYAKYKELTAMKSDPNRMMTIAQIESIQAQIEQDLETLEGNPPSQKTETRDQENIQGVSGEVREGKKPVATQPVESPSAETTEAGGVLQAPQEEVTLTTEAATTPFQKQKDLLGEDKQVWMYEATEAERNQAKNVGGKNAAKFFPKKISKIKEAVRRGLFEKAIEEGRMTAQQAADVISSADLEVPASISETKPTAPVTEKPKTERKKRVAKIFEAEEEKPAEPKAEKKPKAKKQAEPEEEDDAQEIARTKFYDELRKSGYSWGQYGGNSKNIYYIKNKDGKVVKEIKIKNGDTDAAKIEVYEWIDSQAGTNVAELWKQLLATPGPSPVSEGVKAPVSGKKESKKTQEEKKPTESEERKPRESRLFETEDNEKFVSQKIEEIKKNGKPLSEFKIGDVVSFAEDRTMGWVSYIEGVIVGPDEAGNIVIDRLSENPKSEVWPSSYVGNNSLVILKPKGEPVYTGEEGFRRTELTETKKAPETKPKEKPGKKPVSKKTTGATRKSIGNTFLPNGVSPGTLTANSFYEFDTDLTQEYPELLRYNEFNIGEASAVEMYLLVQMPHPNNYGFNVSRSTVLKEWEKRGEQMAKELGLPTNPNALYKNNYTGNVDKLKDPGKQWWSVVEHSKPLVDYQEELKLKEKLLKEAKEELQSIKKSDKEGRRKQESKIEYLNKSIELLKEGVKNGLSTPVASVEVQEQKATNYKMPSKVDPKKSEDVEWGNETVDENGDVLFTESNDFDKTKVTIEKDEDVDGNPEYVLEVNLRNEFNGDTRYESRQTFSSLEEAKEAAVKSVEDEKQLYDYNNTPAPEGDYKKAFEYVKKVASALEALDMPVWNLDPKKIIKYLQKEYGFSSELSSLLVDDSLNWAESLANDVGGFTFDDFKENYDSTPFAKDLKSILEKEAGQPKKETTTKPKGRGRIAKIFETEGEEAAEKVQKFVEESGIKVEIIDDQKANELGQSRKVKGILGGVFIDSEGKIYINRDRLRSSSGKIIAFHEGIHPVINIIRNTNPELYQAIVDGIKAEAKVNGAISTIISDVKGSGNYNSKGTVEDEVVVETLSQIATGDVNLSELSRSLRDMLVDFMNWLADKFGFNPIMKNSSARQFREFAQKLSFALNNGGTISDVVGKENVTRYENMVLGKNDGQFTVSADNVTKREIVKDSNVDRPFDKSLVQYADIDEYDGKVAVGFLGDKQVVGNVVSPTGVKLDGRGGGLFPVWANQKALADLISGKIKEILDGSVWATTDENGANKLMNALKKGTLAAIGTQAPKGVLGNKMMLEHYADLLNQALKPHQETLANSKSTPKQKAEAKRFISELFDAINNPLSTNYKKDFPLSEKLIEDREETISIRKELAEIEKEQNEVKDSLKNKKITPAEANKSMAALDKRKKATQGKIDAIYKKGIRFNTIQELYDELFDSSYEVRTEYFTKVFNIGNSNKFGIPSIEAGAKYQMGQTILDYANDPMFANTEYGDVVGFVEYDPESLRVVRTEETDEYHHKSYHYVVTGTIKSVKYLNNAVDVRSIFYESKPAGKGPGVNQTPFGLREKKSDAARGVMGAMPAAKIEAAKVTQREAEFSKKQEPVEGQMSAFERSRDKKPTIIIRGIDVSETFDKSGVQYGYLMNALQEKPNMFEDSNKLVGNLRKNLLNSINFAIDYWSKERDRQSAKLISPESSFEFRKKMLSKYSERVSDLKEIKRLVEDDVLTMSDIQVTSEGIENRGQMSAMKRSNDEIQGLMENAMDEIENAINEGADPQQAVNDIVGSQDWYGELNPKYKNQFDEILQDEFGATPKAAEKAKAPKETTKKSSPIANIVDNYYKIKDGERTEKTAAREAINEILEADPKLKYIYNNIREINKQLQAAGVITDKTDGCP